MFSLKKDNLHVSQITQAAHGHMVTYRHAIEGQLAVNFKLVGRGHTSTGVHQGITELKEEREKKRMLDFFCNRRH